MLEKGYSGREVRYALIRVHYRAPLNFTWEGMEEARQALARIDEWLRRLREAARGGNGAAESAVAIEDDKFFEALDDDLNISAALGHLFEQIRESNRELDGGIESGPRAAPGWNGGSESTGCSRSKRKQEKLPPEIVRLAEERVQARLARELAKK